MRTLMLVVGFMGAPSAVACEAVVDASAFIDDDLVEHVDIVWDDGVITHVGPTGQGAADGCTVHAARTVTVPLMVLGTSLGLVEIELEASTRDDRFARPRPATPEVRALDGHDPRSEVIPLTRQGGISQALVVPSGGFVSGTASVVSLNASSRAEAAVRAEAGLVVDLAALGSRAAGFASLRHLVETSRAWARAGRPDVWPGATLPTASLAAIVDAVGGEGTSCGPNQPMQIWVHANRAADLESLAALSRSHGLCVGVLGGAEAWSVAEDLASAHVGVVLDPMVYGAGTMAQRHGRADNAALLHEAGVSIAFAVPDAHRARSLRWLAGNAVRGGLPWAAAMHAVMVAPRALAGIPSPRLAVGESAELALWTGDPLDIPGELVALIEHGEPVSTRSRQDVLVERYRTLPPPRFPEQSAP